MPDSRDTTTDRWERVSRLFMEATALAPAARASFLDQCPPDLREEIAAMLAADDGAEDFFDGLGSALAPEISALASDGRLGAWQVAEPIGRGGMGTVYRAVRADGAYEQQAALKVLDSVRPDVVARFERERQILARLDHPAVARLLDGGQTPEGRPFLVMELVDGEPITDYATRCALSVDERIDLFVQVCEVVQAAHRQLVVHRDLKPSNVFVVETSDGPRVKLLDFGIARILEDDADGLLTLTEQRVLTPEYAAPEQIRGEAPTTATDVYALGVLLYELLAGARPFDMPRRLAHEAARVILEEEPERPSTAVTRAGVETLAAPRDEVRQRLEGDLDAVCLKALRKEPERRYATAEAFARDLDRHLRGLTVEARPDTARYRASRFVRRHRRAMAGATLAMATLLAGLSTALWQASEARAERDRAERLSEYTLGLFATQDPFSTEALPDSVTFAEVVRLAAGRAEADLSGRDRLRVLSALGAAVSAVGREGSLDICRRAHEIALREYGAESAEAVQTAGDLAWIIHATDPATSDSLFSAALATADRLRLGPEETASLRSDYGYVLNGPERQEEAEALFRRAIADFRAAGPDERHNLGTTLQHWAVALAGLGRHDEAKAAADESMAVVEEVHGRSSAAYASVLGNMARVVSATGDTQAAVRYNREALSTLDALGLGTGDFALTLLNNLAVNSDDPAEQIQLLHRVRVVRAGAPSTMQNLGVAHMDAGSLDSAAVWLQRARAAYLDSPQAETFSASLPLVTLADVRLRQGRASDAERHAAAATRALAERVGPEHWVTLYAGGLLGAAEAERGAVESGQVRLRRAIEAVEAQGVRHTTKVERLRELAEQLDAQS